MRFGFVGAAYRSQSVNAAAQQAINWYAESTEGNEPDRPIVYNPSPGTKTFASVLPNPGGASPSFDKAVTAVSAATVGSFSVGPLNPTTLNEWVLLTIAYGNVITVNAPFTSFGPGVHSFATLNASGPVTSTGTFSVNSSYSASLMAFYSIGSAPTIANSNSINASFNFTVSPRTIVQALTNPTTAGNSIIVTINELGPTNGTATITDSSLNTYALISDITAGAVRRTRVYLAQNIAGGADTVTVVDTAGFASSWDMAYMEITPLGFLASGNVRGEKEINGRAFAVVGVALVELFPNGSYIQRGTVANDSQPVTIAASSLWLLVGSGGFAYTLNLQTNAFVQIPPANFAGTVSRVGYSDGFFIVTITNSRQVYASAVEDASTWPGLSTTLVSLFPSNIVSSIIDHRELWLFSNTSTIVYEDTGASPFPFEANPSAYIEQGCAAKFSTAKLDNTIFWLGADERGNGIVWRASGYTPTRISTHAMEFAFQGYPRIDDAIAYTFQDQGHSFYHLYFPSADKSWRYDTATNMWHQVGFWDAIIADFHAHHSQCHMFVFGKHLVGDWASGKIYQMNIPIVLGGGWDFVTDDGNTIRRVRRAPHIAKEQKRIRHNQLQVYLESGLGPQPPLLTGGSSSFGPFGNTGLVASGSSSGVYPTNVPCVANEAGDYIIVGTCCTGAGSTPAITDDLGVHLTWIPVVISATFAMWYAIATTAATSLFHVVLSGDVTPTETSAIYIVRPSIIGLTQITSSSHTGSSNQANANIGLLTGQNLNLGGVLAWQDAFLCFGGSIGSILFGYVGNPASGLSDPGTSNWNTLNGSGGPGAQLQNWAYFGTGTVFQTGVARDPQVMLRWSNDGGHVWSNEQMRPAGQAGQFRKRVIYRRLGRARDRVYEVSVSDPVPWRLIDAYLDVGASNGT